MMLNFWRLVPIQSPTIWCLFLRGCVVCIVYNGFVLIARATSTHTHVSQTRAIRKYDNILWVKVSKSQKQFMVSWILLKNEFSVRFLEESRTYFFRDFLTFKDLIIRYLMKLPLQRKMRWIRASLIFPLNFLICSFVH